MSQGKEDDEEDEEGNKKPKVMNNSFHGKGTQVTDTYTSPPNWSINKKIWNKKESMKFKVQYNLWFYEWNWYI